MKSHSRIRMTTPTPSSWHRAILIIASVMVFSPRASLKAEPPAPNSSRDLEAVARSGATSVAPPTSAGDAEIIPRKPAGRAAGNRISPPVAPSGGWMRMLQPIAVVFAIMALLTWAGRKWLPQARQASNAQSVIRVLARQHLSSKQSLCLVKLGPKVVLLGVTPESIASVLEIRDPDDAASLVAAVESTRGRSFTRAMAAFSASTEQEDARELDSPDRSPDANEQIKEMVRRVRELGAASHARTGSKLPAAPRP